MKIILSGGETLGPVVPLLAMAEAIRARNPKAEFIWVGTKNGPEREMVEYYHIPFYIIITSKWRRYFSLRNVIDFFKLVFSFIQSLFFVWRQKPHLLISAGGFVSVPLHWAAALLGIPTWIHQQDVQPGLANRLMTPFAKKITTALQETTKFFPANRAEWIGNPSRDLATTDVSESRRKFNLPLTGPVIFALGGGTGSNFINKVVLEALAMWPRDWQIVHLSGKERSSELAAGAAQTFPNYHAYRFFNEEMKEAYAVADVVIGRAGFATLTELASLAKAAVIIPKSGTSQEENARYLAERQAIVMLTEEVNVGPKLAQAVKELIESKEDRLALGQRLHEILPRAKPEKIVEIVEILVKK